MRQNADIYRHGKWEASNGGISSRTSSVVIVSIDEDDTDATAGDNVVHVIVRNLGRSPYIHVEPVASPDENCVGWMAGGTFVLIPRQFLSKVTGIEFERDQMVSLHDRQETVEQYRALSL